MELNIHRATVEHAPKLAELMNIAGEGIPAYLWEQMAGPGEDVLEVGARRVARTEGAFSFGNAHIAAVGFSRRRK